MKTELENVLQKNRRNFHQVVPFDLKKEKLISFNFSASNTELSVALIADTAKFSEYVNKKLESNKAKYGMGGYNEDRILYQRSALFLPARNSQTLPFDKTSKHIESRSVHLGIDIWGPAGTEVYLPVGGTVHSFAFNDNFGDYGATIIMQHQLDTIVFYTLYGHVSLDDIAQLHAGKYLNRGEVVAHFGPPEENGNWPPHLHFQVIKDMNLQKGDFPGVCTISEREQYLSNCPDPDLILNMMSAVR